MLILLTTKFVSTALKLKLLGMVSIISIGMMLAGPTNAYAADPSQEPTPKITRTNVERRINMAQRLLDNEQYNEAIRNLNITIKQYRYNTDAWNLLGLAHRRAGNIEAANAAYTRALSMDRYHLSTLEYQGKLLISMGKLDEAKINLRLMDERCPVGCKEQRDLEAAIAEVK